MTNHLTEAQERELFEAHMRRTIGLSDFSRQGDFYANEGVQGMWAGWLAKADATTSAESGAPVVERVCSTCRHEALSENDGPCAGCGYVAAYDRWESVAIAARPVTSAESGVPKLPHPGGVEISALLDSILAEYNWPSNPKNAARAGWTAAMRYLAARPVAQADAGAPLGAIVNGRTHAERVEFTGFECETGNLQWCNDWVEFRRCFEHLAEWVQNTLAASAQATQAVSLPTATHCPLCHAAFPCQHSLTATTAGCATVPTTQAVEPVAAEEDKKRLDYLDAAANEMLLEFGFEIDGGVYLRIDAPGHGGTDIREKNSARAAIDSAMVVAPC